METLEYTPNQSHYPIFNAINAEKSKKTYYQIIEKIKKITHHFYPLNPPIHKNTPTIELTRLTQPKNKNINVGLVLWYQPSNPQEPVEILTGIETHYLTETFHPDQSHTQEIIERIKNFETIPFPCSSNKIANQIFKERAQQLSELFQIPVSFEAIPSPSLSHPFFQQQQQEYPQTHFHPYQTHFRIIKTPTNPKYGIIKGKVEKGENPMQAMLREMEEELQLPLKLITTHPMELLPTKKIQRFQDSVLYTFHKQLTHEEYIQLKEWIQKNNPQGEMMEFAFRPLSQINNNKKTNAKSTEHIKTFRKNILSTCI